ncbi:hypothetical protein PYW07_010214 [Mythimna separata]|uniref:Transposable element P transposase n=1 Tax=Mythimna separata TaxID=271217 RepID=A0AAD7YHQ7_MYTSE|nr:hypothetical protein PYW07_010214 [Mythimna separata]
MRPRYLNSDPIENFFGQMRAYNFRNTNPDCHAFKSTFKSLLITRFIKFHSDSYNCEEDSGKQLLKLKSLFNTEQTDSESLHTSVSLADSELVCSPESSELSTWVETESIQSSARQERLHTHSRAFTAGWVIRKILQKIKCLHCEENLTSRESSYDKNTVNNWISFREFKSIKQKKLTYPSENAVIFFGNIMEEANKYLESQPERRSVIKNIKNHIKSKYLFDFINCELHKDAVSECFLGLTLRLAVFNWCNIINKILKGTDVFRLANKTLPQMQAKALNKFKSKLKNKKK